MKNLLKLDIKTILIVVLAVAFLLQRCGRDKTDDPVKTVTIDGEDYDVLKEKSDTQYIETVDTFYKPGKTIYITNTIHDTITADVDTSLILREFFATNQYKDTTVLDDSMGYIVIDDKISQNKIKDRMVESHIFQRSITNTMIVKEQPKNEFYMGFDTRLDKVTFFNSIGGTATLKTKKDRIYNLGVGISNTGQPQLTPYISVGTQWRIKFK